MDFPELKTIKERRKKLGVGQKLLASLSGVSQSLIAKIESQKVDPSYKVVKQIFVILEKLENKSEKRVKDIMKKKIFIISEDKNIEEVINMMKEKKIFVVPVVSVGQKERVVGVIDSKNLFERLDGLEIEDLRIKKVSEVMNESFNSVSPESPISLVYSILKINDFVFVMKSGELAGIVSREDFLWLVYFWHVNFWQK